MGLGYAWVASGLRTFTEPAAAATGVPIIAVAVVLARGRRDEASAAGHPSGRGLVGWATLALALFVWEMYELLSSPRHDHPTLSSIGDAVLHTSRLAHAAAFALWLAAGIYLTRTARSRRAP